MATRRAKVLRWILRVVTENVALKIFAVVAAIALFSLVHGTEEAQRSISVDVTVLPPTSDDKILITELPHEVDVTMRGSRAVINSVRRDDIPPVEINLADTSRRYYYFDPASFKLPAGISVVQVTPAMIPLRWEPRADRRVPVRAHVVGQPAQGMSIVEPVSVDPPTVLVRGPEQEVALVESISTVPIEVRRLGAGTIERRVPLEEAPAHTMYVDARTARVRVEIRPNVSDRRFSRIEVAVIGAGATRAELRPRTVDVVLRGPPASLAELDAERVVPFVDVESIPPGPRIVAARIGVRGVPSGVEVLRIEPEEVLVRIGR